MHIFLYHITDKSANLHNMRAPMSLIIFPAGDA